MIRMKGVEVKKEIAILAAGCFWGDRRLRLMRQTTFFSSRRARNKFDARAALFLVCSNLDIDV